jgi:hypothetical protein
MITGISGFTLIKNAAKEDGALVVPTILFLLVCQTKAQA